VRCPFCKDPEADSRVLDSRESGGGFVIRRRRECTACGRRYTTYERVEEAALKVVKKDGRREPFERAKIVQSLRGCCQKRPVSEDQVEAVADELEREVREVHDREVPSRFIGELLMLRLRQLDPVAYVRYASVYREFREPQDFLDELRPLLEPPAAEPGSA
jgi:transcriptional repressor NrdR